jgi:hypothetical protein
LCALGQLQTPIIDERVAIFALFSASELLLTQSKIMRLPYGFLMAIGGVAKFIEDCRGPSSLRFATIRDCARASIGLAGTVNRKRDRRRLLAKCHERNPQ